MSARTVHPDGTTALLERDWGALVVCPWCDEGGIEVKDDGAHPCPKCGRHIDIEVEVEVTYSWRPTVTVDELLDTKHEAAPTHADVEPTALHSAGYGAGYAAYIHGDCVPPDDVAEHPDWNEGFADALAHHESKAGPS